MSAECVCCGRPCADAFLCPDCVGDLVRELDAVPELVVELDLTLARLHRIGPAASARGEALPYHGPASEARYVLGNVLRHWTCELSAKRGLAVPVYLHWRNPVPCSRWLARHADAIRLDDDAEQITDEIADAISLARRAIDRPAELVIAGRCEVDGCRAMVYARPEAHRATCRTCGAEHDVAERREQMLATAADQLVTVTVALGWARALLPAVPPRGTVDSWIGRSRLLAHGRLPDGHLIYRFGDLHGLIVDWLAWRSRRRAA
jgi:hypothetical protein